MRVFSSISLVIFYLFVSVGIGYNMHFCGGNLSSVDLYTKTSACCCDEDAEMANNCCNDESSFFQFTPHQKLADNTNISVKEISLFADLFIEIQNKVVDDGYELKNSAYRDLSPPDPERIYLLNSSFLFYG